MTSRYNYRQNQRILSSKQTRDLGNAVGELFLLVTYLVAGLIIFIIFIFPVIFLTLLFILIFISKTIFLGTKKLLKKEDGKIIRLSSVETHILGWIKKSASFWRKSMDSHFSREGAKEHGLIKQKRKSKSEKFCVMCGAPLRSRRKYCSDCRPSGKQKPYWAAKQERLDSYERNYQYSRDRGWVD